MAEADEKRIYRGVVIGAGAAGLAAGCFLPPAGWLVLDAGAAPGRKILASGGGRCNVAPVRVHPADYSGAHPQIVHHVAAAWPVEKWRAWWADLGVPWKREGERYYPASGDGRGLLAALLRRVRPPLATGVRVGDIRREEGRFRLATARGDLLAERVLVASGGPAWPQLGADGALWAVLERLGHRVSPARPALCPLLVRDPWWRDLSGISADVVVRNGRSRFAGTVLLTHQGLSGPVVMDNAHRWEGALALDWLPGLPAGDLEAALLANAAPSAAMLRPHLPAALAKRLWERAGAPERAAGVLPRPVRRALAVTLKEDPVPEWSRPGFREAQVTAGGVDAAEIDPRTFRSRMVENLWLAGEIVDVTGRCGGFNLYWAFSSGALAGAALADG